MVMNEVSTMNSKTKNKEKMKMNKNNMTINKNNMTMNKEKMTMNKNNDLTMKNTTSNNATSNNAASILQEKINQYVLDPEEILTGKNGLRKGVYAAYIVAPATDQRILMYIGETGKGDRTIRDRILEHLEHWLSNPEYYCGVKKYEFLMGYRIKITILACEADHDRRYQMEQDFCERMKPYLQCGVYPKFDSRYKGYDLCIFPTYRRRAFLFAKDGCYHENITDKVNEVIAYNRLKEFIGEKAPVSDIRAIEKQMPKNSERHLTIKQLVDRNLRLNNRGCTYQYLVNLLAAALKPASSLENANAQESYTGDVHAEKSSAQGDFAEPDYEQDADEERELTIGECLAALDIDDEVFSDNVDGD